MKPLFRSKVFLSIVGVVMALAAILALPGSVLHLFLRPSGTAASALTLSYFSVPSGWPTYMTAGPDGNVWFTEDVNNKIGRITPSGTVSEFPLPTSDNWPTRIAGGADGNLWFTERGKIGRITPSGSITEFPLPDYQGGPWDITAAPDGNLWFTEYAKIGRITPSGVFTEYPLPSGVSGFYITASPDGSLWFSDNDHVGRMATDGTTTVFAAASDYRDLSGIRAGPDGTIWFGERPANPGVPSTLFLGRLKPDGTVTEFPVSTNSNYLYDLTVGPDGNVWWVEDSNIGHITPSGAIMDVALPIENGDNTGNGGPGITAGPDGNIWFTMRYDFQIGRVNLAAARPHNQVAILLQGISSTLTLSQITTQIQSEHSADSMIGMGSVAAPTLQRVLPSNTQYFEYSYVGSGPNTGNPIPYNCQDTFSQPIAADIQHLHEQLTRILAAQPVGTETDLYLVGHSLGGAIALGYLDFLEQGLLAPLPPTAHLKAVITLDSPVGGVSSAYTIGLAVQLAFSKNCSLNGITLASPKDLSTVYSSVQLTTGPDDAGPDPLGAQASFLVLAPPGTTLPRPLPSNEDLVEKARVDLGTSVLTIGNQNDFLWNLGACAAGLLRVAGDIRDTQYVEDDGSSTGTYARSIASAPSTCPTSDAKQLVPASHMVVLSDAQVQAAIGNFLAPIPSGGGGATPSPLATNPYQPVAP